MKRFSEDITWDDFSDPTTNELEEMYLPVEGEGETMANQIAAATSKLVYKWFNDGDVFDNQVSGLGGFANDLSSYANWLHENVPETADTLDSIKTVNGNEQEYTDLLYALSRTTYSSDLLAKYNNREKVGTIYDADGPFSFEFGNEYDDEEEQYDVDDEY